MINIGIWNKKWYKNIKSISYISRRIMNEFQISSPNLCLSMSVLHDQFWRYVDSHQESSTDNKNNTSCIITCSTKTDNKSQKHHLVFPFVLCQLLKKLKQLLLQSCNLWFCQSLTLVVQAILGGVCRNAQLMLFLQRKALYWRLKNLGGLAHKERARRKGGRVVESKAVSSSPFSM